MKYYRDSTHKYTTSYDHAWRLNGNGSVDFYEDGQWRPAEILMSAIALENALFAGDIEECPAPKEYLCNDNRSNAIPT